MCLHPAFKNYKSQLRFAPLTFILGCLLLSLPSYATNYYVNEATTTGDIYTTAIGNNANNGTSPSTPKATLTNVWTTYGPSGTNVLTAGDTVFVDAGTYLQTEQDLYLTVPIVVAGAGMSQTIFDNNNAGVTGSGFVRIGAGVHLQNFKITRYGKENTYAHAIHVESGITGVQIEAIYIDNCGRDSGLYPIEVFPGAEVDFIDGGATCNSSLQSGGVRVQGATTNVSFVNYVFYENSRGFDNGAALRIENGTVSLQNCLFEGNQCNNGGESILYMNNGTLAIFDTEFADNRYLYASNEYGGTILVNGGNFEMRRSTITGTTRIGGSFAYGAGACFDGTTSGITATIDSCYFESNTGSRGNDIHVKRSGVNVSVFETTFASSSQQLGFSTNGVMTVNNSGNPNVYNNFSGGSVTLPTTTAPSYSPTPSVPGYTGTCGNITLLPVELISFEGFCKNNHLTFEWVTASERNNAFFEVLYSENGKDWELLGKIEGAGSSQVVNVYQYHSEKNRSGYYILKQTDQDGRSESFNPISISNCMDLDKNEILAHYESENLKLSFFGNLRKGAHYTVQLMDQSGKTLESQSLKTELDVSFIKIQNELQPGVYIYSITSTNETLIGKMIVSR